MQTPLQFVNRTSRNSAASTTRQFSQARAALPAVTRNPLQLQSSNTPAQLNGGWILSQLWSLASNPYVIAAGLIGLPVIYWLQQRSKGIKADPPEQVSQLLGVDTEQLIRHLNREDGGFTKEEATEFIERFFSNRQTKGRSMEPEKLGLIPSVLIDGLYGSESQKLEMLFKRFNKFPFYYSGDGETLLDGFIKGSGDCKTLVNMFSSCVRAAGITDIKHKGYNGFMLVEQRPIHGRTTKGNVYQEKCWFFTDHHSVKVNGQFYDLLFMTKQKPVTSYLSATKNYNDVTYYIFDNDHCFIHQSEVKEKLNFDIGDTLGIVFDGGEGEAFEFIDKYC